VRAELNVKYFDHEDLPVLNEWLRLRGHKAAEVYDLPAVGFLVSEGDFEIAACFLRRCEGGLGIVEGLTSNPTATSALRHQALDMAIQCVIEEAKSRDITKLLAWTVDAGTQVRSIARHGFVQSHQTFMTKDMEAPATH